MPSTRRIALLAVFTCLLLVLGPLAGASAAAGNTITVTFDSGLRSEAATGRLLVLMVEAKKAGGFMGKSPLDAPMWDDPQPIYSVPVAAVKPGEAMVVDDSAAAFPGPLSTLTGEYAVIAVLDVDRTTSSFSNSSDNLRSEQTVLKFDAAAPQNFALTLNAHIEAPSAKDTEDVKLVEVKSTLLSDFFKYDVFLRAAVILPVGYDAAGERRYPAIYSIPGFGGRCYDAFGPRRTRPGARGDLDANAFRIVLDPDGPYGHTLFVNSENNGPVGDALVKELIPEIEKRFRLISEARGRLVTGHSSGGFTSAWLQVNYPDVFGGCWSTSPDSLDFRAFQNINAYEDANAYSGEAGDRASVVIGGKMVCTVRQENGMENAMDPNGASGQQWDSWFAAFSPKGADGYPVSLWDPGSGAIRPELREFWKERDVNLILQARWGERGEVLKDRFRVLVGDQDNFSLNLAVARVRDTLAALPGWRSDWSTDEERAAHGYIEILTGRDHFNLMQGGLSDRIAREMLLNLKQTGCIPAQ